MGIYETYSKGPVTTDSETGLQTWTEYQEWPGYKKSRTVTATLWEECERTDCYCCSCGDREGSDVACRNHGWAATRPCETHNMPGQTWGEEAGELEGKMPATVQQARALRASEEANGDKAR